MKKILFYLVVLIFCGCSSDRKWFIDDMTEGCLKTYAGANSDIVCRCVSEIVSENFSDKELKYYRRFQKEQPWTLEEQNIASSLRAKIQKFASLDVYLTKQEFQQFGETLQNCILQKQ